MAPWFVHSADVTPVCEPFGFPCADAAAGSKRGRQGAHESRPAKQAKVEDDADGTLRACALHCLLQT
ncbi:MAG: hypothetical protein EOO65_03780 [Methanosarcinales archaeon]|nr:MAG: hypothetical protein EOO65_03780 [Methanosarcinales archaeon]